MKDQASTTIGVKKKRWVVCFENTILDMDLSIYEKMVYIVLCSHAKKDGPCFPSVKTIAEEASCSRTKVFEALSALEDKGIIVRDNRIYEERGQTSNNYEIIDIAPRPPHGRGGENETHPPFTTRTGPVRDADAPIDVFEQDQVNKIKDTPTGSAEKLAPPVSFSEIPVAMRQVAEYLLLKTGRMALLPSELPAIRALERIHNPARINQEIGTALKRFEAKGRDPASLTFEYLYESLRHQNSRSKKTPRTAPKKTSADDERRRQMQEFERAEREEIMRRYGGVAT